MLCRVLRFFTLSVVITCVVGCLPNADPKPRGPGNQPPTIQANQQRFIVWPTNSILLDVTVTDDNTPINELTYQWEAIGDNAANVSLTPTDSEDTTANFTSTGVYTVTLSVSDRQLSSSISITITVSDESGLDNRPVNTTCIAPDNGPATSSTIELQTAFSNLQNLGEVTALRQAPGDPTQFYAITRQGKFYRFANDAAVTSATEIFSITNNSANGTEQGLLGFDFHPDYQNNGEIYFSYTRTTNGHNHTFISRYKLVNDTWTNETVLEVHQPFGNHNGGNILFGPDGYLYIGLGDGGSGNDPEDNGLDPTTLLGSMLRIDVTNQATYAIPSDNPFHDQPICNDPEIVDANPTNCPEIFAYGLRNPWRWSFDRVTGTLWLGDVGQNRYEEIDIIENGKNYGWRTMEGKQCNLGFSSTEDNCDRSGLTPPVHDYGRSDGNSVVGGYAYRGSDPQLQFLQDSYLFSDTYSKHIWKLTPNGNGYTNELLTTHSNLVYSFAEALNGDLYVISPTFGAGTGENFYKIVGSNTTTTPGDIPTRLSESGCFNSNNPTQVAPGVIPYSIHSPLWSDGAEKERYLAIPDNQAITITSSGDLVFPVGTVLIKNFKLNDTLIETRLLMRHANTWGGYSYEWEYDSQGNPTDAVLLADGKQTNKENQTWLYPSRTQCFECHTTAANIALGLETHQLNKLMTYTATNRTANQLSTLEAIGMFDSSVNGTLKASQFFALTDTDGNLEQRAKSYFHSNCSHCHRPDAASPVNIDMRYLTSFANMQLCNKNPEDDLGLTGIKRIDPLGTLANPNSMVVHRMETLSTDHRMPPLASFIPDNEAITLMKTWIDGLSACP